MAVPSTFMIFREGRYVVRGSFRRVRKVRVLWVDFPSFAEGAWGEILWFHHCDGSILQLLTGVLSPSEQ